MSTSPTLRQLVQKNLTRWMLAPFIALLVLLGAYSAYERSQEFEKQNSILADFIGRQTSNHIQDAKVALRSLSTNITRYDPFWFHWVLSSFLEAYPHFERLVYLGPDGKILAASPQTTEMLTMQFFLEKVEARPHVVSRPMPSPASQNLVVYIAMRLGNDNILVGELNLSTLQEHLRDLYPEDQGVLILTDAYGNLISHPNFEMVATQTNVGHLPLFQEDFTDFHTGAFEENGVTYFGTAARLPQSNWILLIAQPIEDVFLPVLSPLLALLTLILCVFFIFANFLQIKLRESIVMPLAMFTESISLTAQGKYRRPGKGAPAFSELDIIEQEFGEMVRQVRAREKEIRENEERFRQLVENINEMFWITDLSDNAILYASPSYEMIWGRTRESLYDNPESFFLAVKKDDRLKALDAYNALLANGKVMNEELRIELPDGSERWVRLQSFPIYDENGRRVRAAGVAEDITERKIIQGELIAAEQEAVFANKAKTEFLTNMSHELRTPLNGILGMLQLTSKTQLTTEQNEYVQTAISSSKVLLNVINDILNVAQIESGKLILHKRAFSLFEIMETIYNAFKHTAESKGIDLIVDIEPGMPPFLVGDELRIRQILFNILGNSIKFTDQGKVSLHAQLLPVERQPGRATLLLVASDTGIGIPAEKIEYVFDSFTQVDGTYTRKHQGTGLGLGIVKSLVDYMEGTIFVESEIGEGANIYITLQLDLPDADERDKTPLASEQMALTKRLSILIVEDDRVNQIAISRMLENLGHQTEYVGDGQKALDVLAVKSFDCVFMDIQMPILDGMETTRRIRSAPEMAHVADIPIIALTAHAMPEDRDGFLEVGMNDYVSKPVSFEKLASTLRKLFQS